MTKVIGTFSDFRPHDERGSDRYSICSLNCTLFAHVNNWVKRVCFIF